MSADLPLAWIPWWLDNLLAFSVILYAGVLIGSILLVLVRRTKCGLFLLCASLYAGMPMTQLWLGHGKSEAQQPLTGDTLTLLQANLSYRNPALSSALQTLRRQAADIIVLQEVNDAWGDILKAEFVDYPYRVGFLQVEGFPGGLAILSRWPIVTREITRLPYKGGDVIRVLLQTPVAQTPFQLTAVHPPSPRSGALWLQRNQLLHTILQQPVPNVPGILTGDFNTSPWSPVFRRFLSDSNWHWCSYGQGIVLSWRPVSILPWLGLHLDHCFVQGSVSVINQRTLDLPGSDHLAVKTQLAL